MVKNGKRSQPLLTFLFNLFGCIMEAPVFNARSTSTADHAGKNVNHVIATRDIVMENVIEKQAGAGVKVMMMENGLDLAVINPRNRPQFSPNLYKFLKTAGTARAGTYRVFRDADNVLWIGSLDSEEHWFHGAQLMSVLCFGSEEQVWAHPPGKMNGLQEVTGFWWDYMHIGRCAIDTEHKKSFIGDETRWAFTEDGNHRSCQWCGKVHQKMEAWIEEVPRERWVNSEKPETAWSW
jgi:hypothetical protein